MKALRASLILLALACSASAVEKEPSASPLAEIKRIYVEQLGGGQNSDQIRDMIIAAIQNSGLFVITENQQRADGVIKGSADDRVFIEEHNTSDSVGVHASLGTGSSSGNAMAGTASSHRSTGAGISDTESSHIQDRRHESSASIRIIDTDGDVVWSTTQESGGGKFRGAMADVADKIVRQLIADVRKARQPRPPSDALHNTPAETAQPKATPQ